MSEDMEMEAQISGAGHTRDMCTVFRHVRWTVRIDSTLRVCHLYTVRYTVRLENLACLDQPEV